MELNKETGMAVPKVLNKDYSIQKNILLFPEIKTVFYQAFGIDKIFRNMSFIKNSLLTKFDYGKINIIDAASGCFMMVKKQVIKEVGGFDEDFYFYGEDLEWCKRIRSRGWKIMYIPEACILHYGGSSTAKESLKYLNKLYDSFFTYWRKNNEYVIVLILLKLLHLLNRFLFYKIKTVFYKLSKEEKIKKNNYYNLIIIYLKKIRKSYKLYE